MNSAGAEITNMRSNPSQSNLTSLLASTFWTTVTVKYESSQMLNAAKTSYIATDTSPLLWELASKKKKRKMHQKIIIIIQNDCNTFVVHNSFHKISGDIKFRPIGDIMFL